MSQFTNYQLALRALERSEELADGAVCNEISWNEAQMELAKAQVYATLHLAEVQGR